jgi:hypothetical protein
MLLIGNGRLITRDNGLFMEDGAVVTDDALILDVGSTDEMQKKYPNAR